MGCLFLVQGSPSHGGSTTCAGRPGVIHRCVHWCRGQRYPRGSTGCIHSPSG